MQMPTSSDPQIFKELIEKSTRILITSHVSPDPDSICSILLLGLTLKENFPDIQIMMVCEELPDNLNFLPGYENIISKPLVEAIENKDLIIIVDAMNFGRCTRDDSNKISRRVKENRVQVAIIDHHEPVGVEDNFCYINDGYSAAVEQVYNTCFEKLRFKKPEHYDVITITGLYSDTGGFTYLNGRYKETLNLIGEIIDSGVKIENIKNQLYQYSEDQMQVIAELARNTTHQDSYTYTFLSDAFVKEWTGSLKPSSPMHSATKIFTDNFIRNIEKRSWGFILYKDSRIGENMYSISFRSIGGIPNVSFIASKLDGGGHKAASGARAQAENVQEAITKIQKVITESL
jgi:phosphoesterase RecJ-like protein